MWQWMQYRQVSGGEGYALFCCVHFGRIRVTCDDAKRKNSSLLNGSARQQRRRRQIDDILGPMMVPKDDIVREKGGSSKKVENMNYRFPWRKSPKCIRLSVRRERRRGNVRGGCFRPFFQKAVEFHGIPRNSTEFHGIPRNRGVASPVSWIEIGKTRILQTVDGQTVPQP